MILKTQSVKNNIVLIDGLQQELSLDHLVSFLREKVGNLDSYEQAFPKLILERILSIEQEEGKLSLNNIDKYEEIFSYLYYYSSNAFVQDEVTWAIGFPIPDKAFYGQKLFYSILDSDIELSEEPLSTPFYKDFEFSNKLLYLLILERIYNLPTLTLNHLYRVFDDDVNRYYHFKIDFSFMSVSSVSGELESIDFSCINDREINSFEDIIPLLAPIDLKDYIFKGFTIMKLIDKSNQHAGLIIQNIISNIPDVEILSDVSSFDRDFIWGKLKDVVKTLTYSNKVQSSFFPLLELNGVPVLTSDLSKESIFFGNLLCRTSPDCMQEVFSYLQSPHTITYGIGETFSTKDEVFIKHIDSLGIQSYVCFPLKQKNKLVGFLEIFTNESGILEKQNLLNIVSYLQLFSNLANDLVSTFKSTMDKVILEKYTSLQGAVQWKFNQEAANYLGELSLNKKDVDINKITFERVFPIYGAIDIRNSTKLRNMAYKKDSYERLALIQLVVDQLDSVGLSDDDYKFITRFNLVKSWLDEGKLDNYLLDILSFFQDEVGPFLKGLDNSDLILAKYQKDYSRDHDDNQDSASLQFEQSLSLLNNIIALEVNQFNGYVQNLFPSYFEKFRTDGIEYDMYVGQSITPMQVFDPSILQKIRKEQILSMISIAKKTFAAMDDLPVSLVTTQLIFIHPNPIDISFRQDERRFDVDGGYNIRYEVIKKRIDKARIKDTKERLVQPNKIAIVYSSERIAQDLRSILEEIAKEQLIKKDIEHVVLEELQGIEQLNSFRVTVAL